MTFRHYNGPCDNCGAMGCSQCDGSRDAIYCVPCHEIPAMPHKCPSVKKDKEAT